MGSKLFPSAAPEGDHKAAGFTLIEVVVALAVVAISLVAIGSLMGTTIRGTRSLEQHVALVETARAIETGLPDRNDLKVGNFSGELADHRWRVDVAPFAASFVDPRLATPWVPQTVIVSVRGPTGALVQIATVRLRRRTEGEKR